ncbi:MAG: hypothetical protein EBR07_06285, partial [Planctomycetes bacterium]|nr:hypothetical protein [Planctomycetota bacterium]
MVVLMSRVDSIPCERATAVTPNTTLTPRAFTVAFACGLALLLSSAATAQDVRRVSASDNPTVIDQKVGDRNSLSTSSRVMQVDLSPHGFERLYAVPGRDDLMMRTNGALYAVFSQSAYIRDPQKKAESSRPRRHDLLHRSPGFPRDPKYRCSGYQLHPRRPRRLLQATIDRHDQHERRAA